MASRGRQVPTTGSRAQLQASRPIPTDQRYPSSDAEKMISRPSTNPYNAAGPAQLSAPVNENFGRMQTAGLPSSEIYGTPKGGYNVKEIGCASAASTSAKMMAIAGYDPNDTKSSDPRTNGNPIPTLRRQAGAINLPKTGTRRRR